MSRLPREPLSAEERELADRLARLDTAAAPSAALDARILAAARDAVGVRGPHGARRRPRWPLALGVAATLALAVGIAWQMRPMQDSAQVYSEAPAAASSVRGAGGPSVDELPTAAADADAAAAAAAPEASQPSPLSAAGAGADDHTPTAQSASTPAHDAMPEVDADREAAAAPQAARQRSEEESANIRFVPPPAPPPPPQPEEPSAAAAAEGAAAKAAASEVVFDVVAPTAAPAAADAAAAMPARAQDQARRAKLPSKPQAEAPDEFEVTGARIERDNAGFSDQALDDQPPATADSPEVQRAWLQRIRELLGKGDTAGARASVAEFKRRYPHYALPDDLRELAPTVP